MKHLLKKKSLFVLFLIVSILVVFSGCSSLQSDESALVGTWGSELWSDDDGTYAFTFSFNSDGTGVIKLLEEINITKYYCEDGYLYMDVEQGVSINYKYRFNEDKSVLYLSEDGDSAEEKFIKISNVDNQNDNQDSNSSNNTDNDLDSNQDENLNITPEEAESALIGTWYSGDALTETLPFLELVFNKDGSVIVTDNETPENSCKFTSYYCDGDILYLIDKDNELISDMRYDFEDDNTSLTLYNFHDEDHSGTFKYFYKYD